VCFGISSLLLRVVNVRSQEHKISLFLIHGIINIHKSALGDRLISNLEIPEMM